jgi:hypothetical protein
MRLTSSWRLGLWGGALALAIGALAFCSPQGLQGLPLMDFAEYWAAGRLNATGANPYDPQLIEELERQAGRDGAGLPMLNPPWTLALVMPLGLLPAHTAHLLWMALQAGALIWSARALWDYYGGNPAQRPVALVLTFTFVPTFLALLLCQISPLLLAGAVLFLVCQRRGRDGWAGAATVLLAIKPHLVVLFWLALVPWAIARRRWWVLIGAALAGLAATGVALCLNPAVLRQYLELMADRPPVIYRTPTLGTLLREAWGEGPFWVQYLSLIPGILWLVPCGLRHRHDWDWGRQLPLLLLVSLLVAPYGAWPFDLVLLLVPVLRVAARLVAKDCDPDPRIGRAALALHLAINGTAAVMVAGFVHFFWFLWMTPALLLAYLGLEHRLSTSLPCPAAAQD